MSAADPRGWITTYTGVKFSPFEPKVEDINIHDIAQSLGNLCRFTGHVSHFYSVADHCVHVSYLVPPQHALAGLLHDASEAYCNDLPRPFKRCPELATYVEAEERVQRVIFEAFGVEWPMPESVHVADYAIAAMEAEKLFSPVPEWAVLRDKPDERAVHFSFYSPYVAGLRYMRRFDELTRG